MSLQIRETQNKELRIAGASISAAEDAFHFSSKKLGTLSMGSEAEDVEGSDASIDPTKYMTMKERAQWNRMPPSKKKKYLKEGIREAERTYQGKKDMDKVRQTGTAQTREKTAKPYQREETFSAAGIRSGEQAGAAQEAAQGGVSAASTGAQAGASAGAGAATGGAAAVAMAGEKTAEKFKEYMQEKAMAVQQTANELDNKRNELRETDMTLPGAIKFGFSTVGAVVLYAVAGVMYSIASAVMYMIIALISVLLPLIIIAIVVVALISGLAASESNRAGYGLPIFVTEEMMELFFVEQEEHGIPVSSGVAQLIVESGFGLYGPGGDEGQGLSQLAYDYKNLFGIKYVSSDENASGLINMTTGEETSSGMITIQDGFSVYPDYGHCIRQRTSMLLSPRYYRYTGEALNENDGEYTREKANQFVTGIKAGGWATSSAYVENCIDKMETYDLYRFDNMTFEEYQAGMTTWGEYNGTVTPVMQRIVEVAENNSGTYPCTPDMCAAWVTGVYQAAGAPVVPYGDAIDMWNGYASTGSISKENIPPGAIVCGSGVGAMGSRYGHVGIYLGNGIVANNVGYFSVEPLEQWCSWQTATCQGHTGWIGWIFPGGVPQN